MIEYNIVYSLKQVAKILDITEEEVWELLGTHNLKYVLICEHIRVRGIDLEQYVNQLSPL